jgi:hypothetical protein
MYKEISALKPGDGSNMWKNDFCVFATLRKKCLSLQSMRWLSKSYSKTEMRNLFFISTPFLVSLLGEDYMVSKANYWAVHIQPTFQFNN